MAWSHLRKITFCAAAPEGTVVTDRYIRSGIEKRHGGAGPSLSWVGRHATEPLSARKGNPRMPAKSAKAGSGGFSAEERAAMRGACRRVARRGNEGRREG